MKEEPSKPPPYVPASEQEAYITEQLLKLQKEREERKAPPITPILNGRDELEVMNEESCKTIFP